MARSDTHSGGNLQPMKELSDFTVEPGDPDPRGWKVSGRDGRDIGKVRDLMVDTSRMKVRYLIVDLDTNAAGGPADRRSVLLDVDTVELRGETRAVIATDISSAGAYEHADYERAAGSEQRTLTRAEEELKIGKREVSSGEARIGKHVETEHVSTPVTRRREEIVTERRPVSDEVRADATISDDEVRIPLMEEEVVVEKRPVVKEELVVGKRTVEERDTVETDVRREEFDIETKATDRTRPGGRGDRKS
jgi:uncharacterized protein (TIGR02271 family)